MSQKNSHREHNPGKTTLSRTLVGAVAGDIIGSIYEGNEIKTTDFPLFSEECTYTDDTVMTVAVADAILNGKDFARTLHQYGRRYPDRGYGGMFREWLYDNRLQPYNSFGNGSAMRASPTGFAARNLDEALSLARKSAEVTHNHPEGIKGAQAIAASIFLARAGTGKAEIRKQITRMFDYDLDFTLDEIRPDYIFDVTCQGSVPQAIVAFIESRDLEDAIRLAISIGGDSDTIACMAGSIAAAWYQEIPDEIIERVSSILPPAFIEILDRFDQEVVMFMEGGNRLG